MKTMKSFLIVLLILFFGLSSRTTYGQTERGKFLLSGSSNFNFGHTNEKWKDDNGSGSYGKFTSLSFEPAAGVFVANGLAIGLQLQISYSKDSYEESGFTYKTTYLIGEPFIRYYFNIKTFKPYIMIYGGGGTEKLQTTGGFGVDVTDKYTILHYGFSPGLAIFLNDNVSLDLGLNYSSIYSKQSNDNSSNYRTTGSNLGFNVGVAVVL
jgi:hypothetical protein